MSKKCGDMARFNRIRKHRINARARIRALRATIQGEKVAPPTTTLKPT